MKIKNKKAYHNYEILDTVTAGMSLMSTEIRPVKEGRITFSDSYCYIKDGELWLRNFFIGEHKQATIDIHEPLRERKLLLTKQQLKKLTNKVKEKGFTIIPVSIFVNEKSLIKMDISLARGKNTYDKRSKIKNREWKIDKKRDFKNNIIHEKKMGQY